MIWETNYCDWDRKYIGNPNYFTVITLKDHKQGKDKTTILRVLIIEDDIKMEWRLYETIM